MRSKPTRRRFIGELAALVGCGAIAGCTAPTDSDGDGGAGNGTVGVDMTDELVFEPAQISIAVGDTVIWENVGSINHSVTGYEDRIPDGAAYFASGGFEGEQAAREAFPEGAVGGGETFEHTFETAGTYEYFCIPHESAGMTGTIEVG